MKTTLDLPVPTLAEGRFASIPLFTDELLFTETGIRIGFTTRHGGVSEGAYRSLNLGSHVQDDLSRVKENRQRLLNAVGASQAGLVVPNQVHGDSFFVVDSCDQDAMQSAVDKGADALILDISNMMGLLCYADCVPVVIVVPGGIIAVIHAGWRGVDNLISVKTFRHMVDLAVSKQQDLLVSSNEEDLRKQIISKTNVYIGPHIHGECFETSEEICRGFIEKFGQECGLDERHVVLEKALRNQLTGQGISLDRIVSVNKCTVCDNENFFSYRAQNGTAGRHGAFAIRFNN